MFSEMFTSGALKRHLIQRALVFFFAGYDEVICAHSFKASAKEETDTGESRDD